jgi:hypothetical protein
MSKDNERVKDMVLIPKDIYEKIRESGINVFNDKEKDNIVMNNIESKVEENDVKVDADEVNSGLTDYSKDEKYLNLADEANLDQLNDGHEKEKTCGYFNYLLKNNEKLVGELSSSQPMLSQFSTLRWKKVPKFFTRLQTDQLLKEHKKRLMSLDHGRYSTLFRASRTLQEAQNKYKQVKDMDTNVNNSNISINNQKPDDNFDDNNLLFGSEKGSLPVERTKEVEQNKPLVSLPAEDKPIKENVNNKKSKLAERLKGKNKKGTASKKLGKLKGVKKKKDVKVKVKEVKKLVK